MVEACIFKLDARKDTVALLKRHLCVADQTNILKHGLVRMIQNPIKLLTHGLTR